MVVLLPDIRSAHNVGSIFRTCDAAGVSRVVLSGYSPRPVDKFGRVQKEIAKTALGGEKTIPWIYEKSTKSAINDLKEEGFSIVGVELLEGAIDYRKYKVVKKVVFVFGNEVDGLSKSILVLCDKVIQIPMRGKKESLNVSVSAGIILFNSLHI